MRINITLVVLGLLFGGLLTANQLRGDDEKKPAKKVVKEEQNDDDDAKKPAKKGAKKEDDDDDDKPVKKPAKKAAQEDDDDDKPAKKVAKKEDSDDDKPVKKPVKKVVKDQDSDDAKPVKKPVKKPAKEDDAPPPKKVKKVVADEDKTAASEESIDPKKLPEGILAAAMKTFPDADVVGAAREKDGDKVVYEVELKQKGLTIDIMFSEKGAMELVEKQIPVKSVPEAISAAVSKKYPKSTIKLAEELYQVTDYKQTLNMYEVLIETADKSGVEVKLTTKGKIQAEEQKGKAGDDQKQDEPKKKPKKQPKKVVKKPPQD